MTHQYNGTMHLAQAVQMYGDILNVMFCIWIQIAAKFFRTQKQDLNKIKSSKDGFGFNPVNTNLRMYVLCTKSI